MGKRKNRAPGPQKHAEGQRGETTPRRFNEKVEAAKEIQRGKTDEHVLSHARIPHEGDST